MLTDPPASAGPLTGLRVLELGHFLAAPFCARLFADLGADVIKVEPPGTGDPMRSLGRQVEGQSLWWSSLARNKRCVTLDLRQKEGQDLARRLASECDVLIENFRAGQLEKWNLGWSDLQSLNPRLIMVRVSGFGQTGPHKDRVAFAPIGEAFGGLRFITADPSAGPTKPPIRSSISLGDSLAGLFAAFGTLAAVYERDVTGTRRGRCLDVSLFESVFALMESSVTDFGALGVVRRPAGSAMPNLAPSNAYRCKDRVWLCITATSDRLFARLAAAMGSPDLATRPEFATNAARVQHLGELDASIGKWAAAHNAVDLEERLQEASVPASRILSIADCVEDPHYKDRGAVQAVEDPVLGSVLHPSVFPVFDGEGSSPSIRWCGPKLGEHTVEVLRDFLGLTEGEIDELRAKAVI